MPNITKKFIVLGVVISLLLLIPFLLMKFHVRVLDPGDGLEEVAWTVSDFVFAGLLLFTSGTVYILVTKNIKKLSQRMLVGIVVFLVLAFIWVAAATG